MRKQLLLILILAFLFKSNCQSNCQTLFTNANAGIIGKLQTFFDDIFSDQLTNKNNATGEYTTFKNSFPSTKSASDLGYCSGVVGTNINSCCTQRFTNLLQNSVDTFVFKKALQRPPIFKLMQWFQKINNDNFCLNFTMKQRANDKINAIDLAEIKQYTDVSLRRFLKQEVSQEIEDFSEEEQSFIDDLIKQNMNEFYDLEHEEEDNEQIQRLKRNLQSTDFIPPKQRDFIGVKPTQGFLFSLQVRSLACHAFSLVATRRYYLGQSCLYCAPTGTLANQFNSVNVKIKTEAKNDYDNAIARSQLCQQKIAEKLLIFINDNTDNNPFKNTNTGICSTTKDSFKTRLSNSVYYPCTASSGTQATQANCKSTCDDLAGFFKSDGGCYANLDYTEGSYSRLLSFEQNSRRMLATDLAADSSGLNAKVVQPQQETQIKVGSVTPTGSIDLFDYLSSNFITFSCFIFVAFMLLSTFI